MPAPSPDVERRKPGRPTKLKDDSASTVAEVVAGGGMLKDAARAAGVHRVTLYRWEKNGNGQDAGTRARELAEALARARAVRLRNRVTWEDILGEDGRPGRRRTRLLPNGVVEVTEFYPRRPRPEKRRMRQALHAGRRAPVLGAGG